MLITKVPAVVAAVLFVSSVSAEAMEFADRPGTILDVVSSVTAIQVTSSDDCSRRQINNYSILLPGMVAGTKLVDRPRPISLVRIRVTRMIFGDRLGRLSAEFSAVAKRSYLRFEYGPGELASWLKPLATAVAMKFENRPGPITAQVKTLTEVSEDRRIFTSSLTKPKLPVGLHIRPGAVEFCVGSIAPCDPLSFAQRPEKQDS